MKALKDHAGANDYSVAQEDMDEAECVIESLLVRRV